MPLQRFALVVLFLVSCRSPDDSRPDVQIADAQRLPQDANAIDAGRVECDFCSDEIGTCERLRVCSNEDPCNDVLRTYSENVINAPAFSANCAGDDVFVWADPIDNLEREACVFKPEGRSANSKRPLLIFAPPSGEGADALYENTTLRDKALAFNLSGDPERLGFIVVSLQQRNLHWPAEAQDGEKFDTFHKVYGENGNRDVAFTDAIIDALVDEGIVDENRIYTSGWSNGARFMGLYSILRHVVPTAGGARVAAVVNFSGGDPFSNTSHDQRPSCEITDYPQSPLPFMLLSRDCDVIACDQSQADGFDLRPSPGNIAGNWVAALETRVGAEVVWVKLSGLNNIVEECASTCRIGAALINHLRWPNGANDHELLMLNFLSEHSL